MTQEQFDAARSQERLDELLRAAVPEIKLSLGRAIDRENGRPLPSRYARLLPDSVLLVTLRPDAADTLEPIAGDLERELTDSCNRHGSLYDRRYRVRLQRTPEEGGPLFSVDLQSGRQGDGDQGEDGAAADPEPSVIPDADEDATRLPGPAAEGWEPGRWVLVVEEESGEEKEVFRLSEPIMTVGRATDDPTFSATIAISEAPHVSRRQFAIVWSPEGEEPKFQVVNLGLNPIRAGDSEISGARIGRGPLDLAPIGDEHRAAIEPGTPVRIGEHGPVVRIDEVEGSEELWADPDATVFE